MPSSKDRPTASPDERPAIAPQRRPPTAPPAPRPGTVDPRAARSVVCTWCNAPTQVAPSAKSVVCPHCNKRLVIEDFHTASYHAVRLLATCGDVVIDKRGHIVAAVRATNLTVDGKLTGNVVAGGCVSVSKNAAVKGDIEARTLRVESGATVSGYLRIGAARANAAAE